MISSILVHQLEIFERNQTDLILLLCYKNAQNGLASCRIETIDKDGAQNLVPGVCLPLNTSFYMPEAVNVHPQRYLQV